MSYSDSIIEAMSTLLGDALAKQKNTKVIEAIVEEILDPTIGLYSLNYLDITIKAYTNNISVSYETGDKVYVLSQDGTLDGNLIIVGSSAPYSGLYVNSNKIQYKPVCESIFTGINGGKAIELCTWQSPQSIDIDVQHGVNFAAIFNHYLSSYKTFNLSMDVRTDIKDPYQKVNGNYGIILTMPMLKENEKGEYEEVDIDYTFDIEKIVGNPYDLLTATPQNIHYTFEDGLIYNVNKNFTLTAFCKDFRKDDSIIEPDIFLSNIQFYPVEVIDPSILAGNYLQLLASQGNYFVNTRFSSTKVITPILYVDGKQVSINNLDTYWFVEDGSITASSKLYNNRGGVGWRCLNQYSKVETVDGATESVLDLSQRTLQIKQEDVQTSLKYKCVIIYNNSAVTQQILIENLNSNVDINVEVEPSYVVSTSEVKMTCTVTYKDSVELGNHYLKYIWTRYDGEERLIDSDFYENGENYNTFVQLDSQTRQYTTDIKFAGSIIQEAYNVIVCSVYDVDPIDNSMVMIGSVQKLIALNSNGDFYLSMIDGNKLYKYDSDGDSPMVANYDGPISSVIHEINPLAFKIYKANGEELSETEYNWCVTTWDLPKNSMMKFGIAKFRGQGLTITEDNEFYHVSKRGKFEVPYEIAATYNASKTDNSALVKVSLGDESGTVLTGVADIRFLKEGESGTNGTRYSAIITYEGLGYNAINYAGFPNKLQLVYIADTNDHGEVGTGTWYYKPVDSNMFADLIPVPANGITNYLNKPTFGVEVYKDGELIDTTVSYSIEWSMFDKNSTKPYFTIENGILKLSSESTWNVATDIRAAIIQVNIKVTDSSTTDSDQIIYVHYPIEMTRVVDKDRENLKYIPTMNGGFDSVLYSTDGTNPKWDTTNPFKCDSYITAEGIKDIFDYYWGASSNLKTKKDKEDGTLCDATPISKYDNGLANNYIFTRMYPSGAVIVPKIEEHINKRNECLMQIAKNYMVYKELKNLSTVFDWDYATPDGQAKEEAAAADVLKYSTQVSNINNKIIQDEEDYKKAYAELYSKDYEEDILNIETELNTYVMKLSLYLKNTFEEIDDYNVEILQENYRKHLDEILRLQNPKRDGFTYIALEDNLVILNDTIDSNWRKAEAQSGGDDVDILLDRAKNIAQDADYEKNFKAIENSILSIQSNLKTLLDTICSTTVIKIQRESLEKDFYVELNGYIVSYLDGFNSKQQAESNLPLAYDEVNTSEEKALYNNNGTFESRIQDIGENEAMIESRNTFNDNYEALQLQNENDLEKAESQLADANNIYLQLLSSRVSEIENWNELVIDNDFLFVREKGINNIVKALNALDELETTFKDLKIDIAVYDYAVKLAQLRNKIYPVLDVLYQSIKDSDITKLTDLSAAKLILTESELEAIKNDLGDSKIQENITLSNKIDSYNYFITEFNNIQTVLITKDTTNVQYIYNKIKAFYDNAALFNSSDDYTDLIQSDFAGAGIDITTDLCDIINTDIHEVVGSNTTSLDVVAAAMKDTETLKTSLNTLLSIFSCNSRYQWKTLYNSDKEISSYKDYQDLILKVFFDIINIYYRIKLSGVEVTSCTLDTDGETLALTEKFNSLISKIVTSFNTTITSENNSIDILTAQLEILNNNVSMIHVKPIVFRLNTYEMSWLNGWDGNKLYTDENGEYIIAPQMGAGIKNDANQFIGITMGVKKSSDGTESDIGLFGFSEKGQSIFLDAKTGKAEFGVTGAGQISMDPTQDRALLYSGNFFEHDSKGNVDYNKETGKGLLIDLTTPEIRFGSGGFWVDKDGNMHVGGTNQENVEPQPEVGIPAPGEYNSDKYLDGLSIFTLVQTQYQYLDTLGNKFIYDINNNVFTKDGVTYKVVSSSTSGVPSIVRRKTTEGYNYSYFDGSTKHEMALISGLYECDIEQKGLGTGTREVYFDPYNNTYWIMQDDKKVEVYANKDKYKKYTYYNKDDYYYYYEDDGTEIRFFYDSNLGVYVVYDKGAGYFYFVDINGAFGDAGTLWILDEEESSYYYWGDDNNKHYMTNEMSSLGGWRIGDDSIYSENKKMKIYSSYKNDSGNPAIFASPENFEKHATLESTSEGCYLGPDGLSIGDALRATNDKGTFIGKLSSTKKTYWRIYGNGKNSYIYYNAKNEDENPNNITFEQVSQNETDNTDKIYVGTDGIVLGNEFMVDTKGSIGPKGTTYVGNIKKNAFWRFHTKRIKGEEVAFMFYDSYEKGESNAILDHFTEEAKDNMYIATNGLRIGYNVMLRPGNRTQLFGYLPNSRGRFYLYYDEDESGDGTTQSYFYSNRDTGRVEDAALTANLVEWNGPVSIKSKRDVYIGTNGIRLGEAFRVDGYIGNTTGGRDKFRVGIMKEDFYIGTRNSDGSITWEPFTGGGGGSLPQAENYSF